MRNRLITRYPCFKRHTPGQRHASTPILALFAGALNAGLLLAAGPAYTQTPVDRLVRTLDSLASFPVEDWKASPDLKSKIAGDPALPGFDDSRWDKLRLDEKIYPDSCWIRKEIVLPERILGRPVAGAVRLKLSVDDYGYLWVDGVAKGHFPWDGDFELTADARPGQKILVAIKAINTGGPLRLIRAGIELAEILPVKQQISDFVTSLRVGQKLLGFDTYQTNSHRKIDPGTDKSSVDRAEKIRLNEHLQALAAKVDADALGEGDLDRFTKSLAEARTGLKPVGEFAKRFTLWFDANAHIDAAWLWREGETVEVCKNTFTSVLNMMDARPDFTYTQSASAYYEWMERLHPDVFRRIGERVRDGRWEIVGGMVVEPDCNLPGGESWMRHLLYGKRYFQAKFGKDVKIGYNPDSFGYNWNMPQFYLDAGIDAFVTQKIGWSERNVFPHRLFWWEGPDGSRILAYFPFGYVNLIDDPFLLTDQLRQFESNTGFTQMMTLFGVGNHGGGPTPDMLARYDHLKTLDVYPEVKLGTLDAYLAWVKGHDLTKVPVWNDELYLEYHQGTFTTQSDVKKQNREGETLLLNAEKFSAVASLYGRPYRGDDLREAWEHVLFNQFHDILPGSGIREIYIDAADRYRTSRRIGEHELDGSLSALTSLTAPANGTNASSSKGVLGVSVFNGLGWERSGPVTVALPAGDETLYGVFDDAGNPLPSQVTQKDKYARELLFIAKGVPSLGYRSYQLRPVKDRSVRTNLPTSLTSNGTTLSNGILEVTVDTASGWIGSVVDKRNGKEILAGQGNRLQLLEDQPKAWDAWNVGLTGVEYPSRLKGIELVESGPVRSTLRVTREYLKPGVQKDYPTEDYPSSFFVQDISLFDGLDYVAFRTGADWWEEKTMLKVAFPVAVRDTAATYEIPYGSIRRSTLWSDSRDSAKVEVPAQRWADLSQADYGVSLLNRAKYGYDIKENVMRLSLLRSPKWPDPTADRGKHSMEYALYPHAGGWKEANTVKRAYEINDPLIARLSGGAAGVAVSFITLEPENLILTGLKRAEDSDAWIVQWYESEGRETEAVLTLPLAPKGAVISDFLEGDRGLLSVDGKTLKVKTRANGTRTVKVTF